MDEQALIQAARGGNLSAFNTLVLAHQNHAYNVAYRLLGNADAAADATQESFLKAYRGLPGFRCGPFAPWLMRIVTNTCYDVLRAKRHRVVLPLENEEGDPEYDSRLVDRTEGPEAYVLRRELAANIQAAISRLPADQRTTLILVDVEGLSYQDVADIMQAGLGTVKSRLWRARAHVRDILSAGYGQVPGNRLTAAA